MTRNILFTTTFMLILAAFSQIQAQNNRRSELKFINNIEIGASTIPAETSVKNNGPKVDNIEPSSSKRTIINNDDFSIEKASKLQLKYSLLLDTEVELIRNLNILNLIDDWFGTRYRLGGTTKSGVDCSALMQTFFISLYGIAIPRTAREQNEAAQRIEKEELEEGDLVFFNTTGGVSHVGMYLQNNKFVHASSSNGVTISDLDESYWAKRFIGAGRIEKATESYSYSKPRP